MMIHQFIVQADQEREDNFSRAMVATDDLACASLPADKSVIRALPYLLQEDVCVFYAVWISNDLHWQ